MFGTGRGGGYIDVKERGQAAERMAKKYRVIHQRKNIFEAMVSGRGYRDWYVAQASGVLGLGWRTLKICPTIEEAEEACRDHAGGDLLPGGARIVSKFVRPD
ncbi:MAG: hypothetical protein JF628_13665 [Sphingomonas sp.]|nr:hypothetical protein [Sphingomonas sp.]